MQNATSCAFWSPAAGRVDVTHVDAIPVRFLVKSARLKTANGRETGVADFVQTYPTAIWYGRR